MKKILAILMVAFSCSATTWFVDPLAPGPTHNGTSWNNAWTSLTSISGVSPFDSVALSGGPAGTFTVYNTSNPWNMPNVANVTYFGSSDIGHNGLVVLTNNPVMTANGIVLANVRSSPGQTGAGVFAGTVFGIYMGGTGDICSNVECVGFNAVASQQATMIVLAGNADQVTRSLFRDTRDIDVFHIFGNNHTVSYNRYTNIVEFDYNNNHTDIYQTWGGSTTNVHIIGDYAINCPCQLGNTEMDFAGGNFDWTFENDTYINLGQSLFSGIPNQKFYNCVFDACGTGYPACVLFYTDGRATDQRSSTNCQVLNCVLINGSVLNVNNQNAGAAGYPAMSTSAILQVGNYSGSTPGFVNEPAGDYHLTSGSVLRNSGTNLFLVFTLDAELKLRANAGPWDGGPLAFAASAPSTTVYGTQLRPSVTMVGGQIQ